MCISKVGDLNVELAVDVFKTRTKASINSLKNFLTVLPNPRCIEQVLTVAIRQLAESDPDACRWLFRNSNYLMPELDLVDVARKFAQQKLENLGFVPGRDFSFDPDGRLYVGEQAKAELLRGNSVCDRLLLEEILQIRNLANFQKC